MAKAKLRSPCIGICEIDGDTGICIGCRRNRVEIRRWKRAGDAEKAQILSALAHRPPVPARQPKLRRHEGGCHCGNVALTFETRRRRKTFAPRACQCSFCRSHGARTITDAEGSVRITVADPARCSFYRFGLKTTEYLVCSDCGVYVAALMREDAGAWATINVNALAKAHRFRKNATPVDYDGEDAQARRARRRAAWTPVRDLPVRPEDGS